MKIVRQPNNSNLCGQTCIAIITDILLDHVILLIKTKGSTRTKQVANVLQNLGFQCESKLKRITKNFKLPNNGIYLFSLMWKNKKGKHWVIWNGDENCWYDPGLPRKLHRKFIWNGMKPTSYLKIQEKK